MGWPRRGERPCATMRLPAGLCRFARDLIAVDEVKFAMGVETAVGAIGAKQAFTISVEGPGLADLCFDVCEAVFAFGKHGDLEVRLRAEFAPGLFGSRQRAQRRSGQGCRRRQEDQYGMAFLRSTVENSYRALGKSPCLGTEIRPWPCLRQSEPFRRPFQTTRWAQLLGPEIGPDSVPSVEISSRLTALGVDLNMAIELQCEGLERRDVS